MHRSHLCQGYNTVIIIATLGQLSKSSLQTSPPRGASPSGANCNRQYRRPDRKILRTSSVVHTHCWIGRQETSTTALGTCPSLNGAHRENPPILPPRIARWHPPAPRWRPSRSSVAASRCGVARHNTRCHVTATALYRACRNEIPIMASLARTCLLSLSSVCPL